MRVATQRESQWDVLLVEDNPADARLVEEYLRDAGSPVLLTHARGLEQAVDQLHTRDFHAVLLDLSLPDCQGLDTFARAHAAAPGAPIVVLTGLDDEDLAARAVREGAQDYLVKGHVDGRLLHHSIRYAIERKRAQATLDDREEQLRRIAENIHEVFFIVDASFRETLYISPAFEQVWGRPCETVYEDPRSFLEGILPADKPRVLDDIMRVQRGVASGGVEFRVAHPDGSVVWVLAHMSPIHDADGKVHRLAGVALDITRRIQAERAVRETDQRLRTLFDTVNLIVLGLDIDGRVDYVNPFFLRVTGYEPEEVVGLDWVEHFLPPDARGSIASVMRELAELEARPHFRNPILTRDGSERMISWHNTIVRDADGHVVGTLSIGEDVTEHELLEQQFQQAQKMEAIGRLAGGVAHDFNNLLTVITGYSDLLLSVLPTESPHRTDVEAIAEAAQKAASLTRQLLAFSRQQVLAPRVLSLNDVVRGSGRMLQRLVGEDIEMVTRLVPDAHPVRADPGQLEQVLLNLAVNARDAMPTGGSIDDRDGQRRALRRTTRGSTSARSPGRYVMLAVSDTGQGMDAATQARIFEPFFTTKPAGQGTGLGLATVYGIVEQSGGFVWVYSEPGQGTTFKIYLPRASEGAGDEPEEAREPVRGGDEVVLLVEDAAPVRQVAREALERHGYTVIEAPSPDVALELVSRTPVSIHLLLTDVVMPGMNGRQLAETARPGALRHAGALDVGVHGRRRHALRRPRAEHAVPAEALHPGRAGPQSAPGAGRPRRGRGLAFADQGRPHVVAQEHAAAVEGRAPHERERGVDLAPGKERHPSAQEHRVEDQQDLVDEARGQQVPEDHAPAEEPDPSALLLLEVAHEGRRVRLHHGDRRVVRLP